MKSTSLLSYFIMQGKRCLMCSGEIEKQNYQEHVKAKFFYLPEFQNSFYILFLRKRLIHFLCGLLLLFVPVGKRSNSRLQMFYKIDPLKDLDAMFTGKHLYWRFFLINFIKKRLQLRCFPVNIAKCLSTAFCIEHLPFIIFFRNFM